MRSNIQKVNNNKWFNFFGGRSPGYGLIALILLALPLQGEPLTSAATVSHPNTPWKRVVMVGASVTAGFTRSEPLGGTRTTRYDLARYFGAALQVPHEPVLNLGNTLFFMDPELIGQRQITSALAAKPTLVVGIDFLFWFCYGREGSDSRRLQQFEMGLQMLEAVHCPLIVGDIPDASTSTASGMLTADEVPSAPIMAAANRRLKKWAADHPQVVVVGLSKFMHTVLADRAVTVHHLTLPNGKTRALLQDDQLHPSPRGCVVLTLVMLDSLESSSLRTPSDQICWDPQEVFRRAWPSK